MKLRDMSILIIVGIVGVVAIVGWVSTRFLGNNNPVEEECEKVIQDETGMKMDLDTPQGAEVKPTTAPTTPVAPTTPTTPPSA